MPDEVGAMDTLEALGQDGPDPEQGGALRRPVAGRAGSVFAAGEDDEGRALGCVAHRGVVDERLVARGEMDRVRPLPGIDQAVAQADVGEGAADHDLVVAPPCPIRVELEWADTAFLEPLTGR